MVGRNILESEVFVKHEIFAPKRTDLNLFDFEKVCQAIEKFQPEVVIHSAGRVGGIQANLAHPVDFLIENLDLGRNVIMAAYKSKVKKLINLGTSCMYPRDAKNPLSEKVIMTGPLEPTNEGYAIAKIAAQRLCAYIQKENLEFHYKTLIPCNLYGKFDKFDPRHSHLVPAIIYKIHQAKSKSENEVEVWGDGHARREFMYSEDLVECIARALEGRGQNFENMPDIMNVGLGSDHSVNEYYEEAAKVIGYKGKFVHDLSKPVGMEQKLVSNTLVTQWGWKSRTTLRDGLTKTYEYFLKTQVEAEV